MERINLQMLEHNIKSKLDAHADPRECCEEDLMKMAEANYKVSNYINRLKFNTIDASVLDDQSNKRGNSSVALRSAHISNERSSSPIKLHKMKTPGYNLQIIRQESFESENSPMIKKKGT